MKVMEHLSVVCKVMSTYALKLILCGNPPQVPRFEALSDIICDLKITFLDIIVVSLPLCRNARHQSGDS